MSNNNGLSGCPNRILPKPRHQQLPLHLTQHGSDISVPGITPFKLCPEQRMGQNALKQNPGSTGHGQTSFSVFEIDRNIHVFCC
jgi:hypothetical protein